MVTWADSGKFPDAAFLCICVDPNALPTAKEFAQLYFGTAPDTLINGFIDSQPDFPNFQAQLGCQGFIVYDSAHQLVATKTLAFNEYRNRAFLDVEKKLSPLLQGTAPKNTAARVDAPQESFDAEKYLKRLASVGHDTMDAQHDGCVNSLVELSRQLKVEQLRRVQHELAVHFAEEEDLLRKYGFGGAKIAKSETSPDTSKDNDFSAFGSHAKDHRRILAMTEDALSQLQNVCNQSDGYGGTVPKAVVEALCKAFVEHALMFDSLYEGKLFDPAVMSRVAGWYNFRWQGGCFPVCFRPGGNFFCPEYRAPATWTLSEDVLKIEWGKFGTYAMTFNEADRSMAGYAVPKDATKQDNWRDAQFLRDVSQAEIALFGGGSGTEWKMAWKEGKFLVKFQADGYNSFVCDDFPARATWSIEGNDITIQWGQYGKYRLRVDPTNKTMSGGEVGGDESKDTWWRKASYVRDLPDTQNA